MGPNRVFFPQDSLDHRIGESRVDLVGNELVIKAENRRYRVVEAVRVLSEVTGTPDFHELVGKVKSLTFLSELGAEILGTSMVLGDNAYEVMPGFMGTAIGAFAEHRAQHMPPPSEPAPKSEEALLAQYLLQALE
ncbi:MAG: hypothetical protein QM784_32025 [Polyangiaceae bacterium]